jgi:hypothetical protein
MHAVATEAVSFHFHTLLDSNEYYTRHGTAPGILAITGRLILSRRRMTRTYTLLRAPHIIAAMPLYRSSRTSAPSLK